MPLLNYAHPRRFARLRRWLRPGSPVFFVLVLALAAAGTWKVWKLQLAADKKSFDERAYFDAQNPSTIWFSKPPTAGSLRHLDRLAGKRMVVLNWPGDPDPSACTTFRKRHLRNVDEMAFRGGMNVDAWLKELARPDTGLAALTSLDLFGTPLTDAGLKELARPDTGLKALTSLSLYRTAVTDAGLKELARPDTGLAALKELDLSLTQVTDAGLRELARPDTGLKKLTWLVVGSTKTTAAGTEALKKARPGLSITY